MLADIKSGDASTINDRLFKLYNKNLQGAVSEVFPKKGDIKALDWHYKFSTNAAKFAAYKAAYVSKTLQKALLDKPEHFDKNGKRIIATFNRFQLTEYNTFNARCRSAKQFKDFQENEVYHNLKWIRSRSADPRELHLKFAGLVLPKTHPFWRKNQPGDLYNCKCDWKLVDAPISSSVPDNVVTPKGLSGNPYYKRRAFTEEHPYFTRPSASEKNTIDEFMVNYVKSQFIKKGKYFIHPLQDIKADDFKDLTLIANEIGNNGGQTFILPTVRANNDLFDYLFYGNEALPKKSPDLLINGNFFEYESHFKSGKVKISIINRMVSAGIKQAPNIVIDCRGLNFSSDYNVRSRVMAVVTSRDANIQCYVLTERGLIKISKAKSL